MAVKEIVRWTIKRGYLPPSPARSTIAVRWEGKSEAGHFGVSASGAYKCTNCCTDTWRDVSRHLLLQACALHKLRVHFGDVSSAFLQTSASEEYQELTIKAPPEVGYLFSDSEGKPARYVRLLKSFYGLTSAPGAWWLDITQKLSQLGWKPMSTDQCLWCRYSDDGELKGVIGIHVDDLLIGLADGTLGEKWMSEISLCIVGDLEGF